MAWYNLPRGSLDFLKLKRLGWDLHWNVPSIQFLTMLPSSAPPNSSDSYSTQSDTLRPNEIIGEHPRDTLLHPADTLPYSADSPSSPLLHEGNRSIMPPYNRSAMRDVHIFDTSDREAPIGGLILTAGITNANLYAMIEIFVIFAGEYILRNEDDTTIEKDDSLLLPRNYYIDSPLHPILINHETILTRTISLQIGTRVQAFRNAVRLRDRRCVITGEEYLDDEWWGFEAAHIFPLAYEQHWNEFNYDRWISTPLNGEESKGGKINSVRNGLLLRGDIRQGFDMYKFSINPDDKYKIVCFSRDRKGIAGKHFNQRSLDDPQRPADQLFRWHFRQAVLANIKGAGEPVFEHDFPPGSDIVGSILKGPKATEMMEAELFGRLATQFDLTE